MHKKEDCTDDLYILEAIMLFHLHLVLRLRQIGFVRLFFIIKVTAVFSKSFLTDRTLTSSYRLLTTTTAFI